MFTVLVRYLLFSGMKYFPVILSLSFLMILALCSAQQSSLDVTHYNYSIRVSDENDSIHVTEIIRFIPNNSDTFSLDLVGLNEKGKGMQIRQHNANWLIHEDNKITFTMGQLGNKSSEMELKLSFSGIPGNGLIIGKNKHGNRTFFADNWPNRAHHWMACNDHPSDKATINFTVNAPSQYACIATGTLKTKRAKDGFTTWEYTSNDILPTKVMVIGIAQMTIKELETSFQFPLSSWVYPEDSDKIGDLDVAVEVLDYFQQLIAPYPFEKLANLQSTTMFGGMENAGNIFYDENAFTGKNNMEDLVAHEIAHQWFGNSASEADWQHLWLSEGFATYFADLFMGHKYGDELFQKRLRKERKQVIQFYNRQATPVVDEHYSSLMSLLNPNSYQKGAWVLHMLRTELGDSAFFKGVQVYYSRFQGKNANSAELQEVFEEVSSKDLNDFFHQWLYASGQPMILLNWTQKKAACIINIQQQQNQYLFKFPLEMKVVYSDGSSEIKTLDVSSKRHEIKWKEKKKIKEIILDPHTKLLFDQVNK